MRDLFLSSCSPLVRYDGCSKDEEASLCSSDFQGTGENTPFVKLLRVALSTVSMCVLASAVCFEESTVVLLNSPMLLRNTNKQDCFSLEVGAGLLLCHFWKQRCSHGFWTVLTILKTPTDRIRHLAIAAHCEQWLFFVAESNMRNGVHSRWSPVFCFNSPSKVERKEGTSAWIPKLDSQRKHRACIFFCTHTGEQETSTMCLVSHTSQASWLSFLPTWLHFPGQPEMGSRHESWSMNPSWLVLQQHMEKGKGPVGLVWQKECSSHSPRKKKIARRAVCWYPSVPNGTVNVL